MQSKSNRNTSDNQRYAPWAYGAVVAGSLMCASIYEVGAMTAVCVTIDVALVGAFIFVAGKMGLWSGVQWKRVSARPCPGTPCHGEACS